jgi:hypothetical protein
LDATKNSMNSPTRNADTLIIDGGVPPIRPAYIAADTTAILIARAAGTVSQTQFIW